MKKRTGTIKDWLAKRQLKFQERDRMRKFAMTLTKKDSMSLDDVVKSYLKKKKTQEYTFEELRDIYNMTDNKDLSTNDLLRLFRKEVPAVEGYVICAQFILYSARITLRTSEEHVYATLWQRLTWLLQWSNGYGRRRGNGRRADTAPK